jgi:hypothetical protein
MRGLTPGAATVPSIVCVLPLPVWPYAMMQTCGDEAGSGAAERPAGQLHRHAMTRTDGASAGAQQQSRSHARSRCTRPARWWPAAPARQTPPPARPRGPAPRQSRTPAARRGLRWGWAQQPLHRPADRQPPRAADGGPLQASSRWGARARTLGEPVPVSRRMRSWSSGRTLPGPARCASCPRAGRTRAMTRMLPRSSSSCGGRRVRTAGRSGGWWR